MTVRATLGIKLPPSVLGLEDGTREEGARESRGELAGKECYTNKWHTLEAHPTQRCCFFFGLSGN